MDTPFVLCRVFLVPQASARPKQDVFIQNIGPKVDVNILFLKKLAATNMHLNIHLSVFRLAAPQAFPELRFLAVCAGDEPSRAVCRRGVSRRFPSIPEMSE